MSNADLSGTPFEILDKRFAGLVNGVAKLERLYTGCRWAEGPAWFGAGQYLLWSDIPNNRIMRWDGTDGSTSVFRQPSNNTNGHTVDRQGRLVSCEHLGRRVAAPSLMARSPCWPTASTARAQFPQRRGGQVRQLDLVHGPSLRHRLGLRGRARRERDRRLQRLSHRSAIRAMISLVGDDFVRPNGLAFSPDKSKLYIADTGATHVENGPRHIRVFDVVNGKTLQGRRSVRDLHGGLVRRLPGGRRRPDLDIGGGWRALLPAGWHAHREDTGAGSGRECLLRRAPP